MQFFTDWYIFIIFFSQESQVLHQNAFQQEIAIHYPNNSVLEKFTTKHSCGTLTS